MESFRSVPGDQIQLRSRLQSSPPSNASRIFSSSSDRFSFTSPKSQLPSVETSRRTNLPRHGASRVPSHFERSFKAYENPFSEDARDMDSLDDMIRAGEAWTHKLYAFRGLARPLAIASSLLPADASQAVRDQVNLRAYNLYKPGIDDLVELAKYADRAISKIREITIALMQPARRKRIVPRAVYARLLGLIDVVSTLDHLKDMKSGVQNEYTTFKRLFESVRKLIPDAANAQNQLVLLEKVLFPSPSATNVSAIAGGGRVLTNDLKLRIHKSPPSQEVILDLFEYAGNELEADRFLLPETKWILLRFLPNAMLLLDSVDTISIGAFNTFRHKNISPLSKLFRKHPCVPLTADMKIVLFDVLMKCPNYQTSIEINLNAKLEWGAPPPEILPPTPTSMGASSSTGPSGVTGNSNQTPANLAPTTTNNDVNPSTKQGLADGDSCVISGQDEVKREFELQHHWIRIRYEYDAISPKIAAVHRRAALHGLSADTQSKLSSDLSEEIQREKAKKTLDPSHVKRTRLREALDREVFEATLESLKTLAKWKEVLLAQSAFKAWKAASDETHQRRLREDDPDAYAFFMQRRSRDDPLPAHHIYEKAVRYNYSKTELNILLDVVCLMKSLAAQLVEYVDICLPCIKRCIHVSIQEFIQVRAVKIQHNVHKRKRHNAVLLLTNMRNLASDWLDGIHPDINDYKEKGLSKRIQKFEKPSDPETLASSSTSAEGASPSNNSGEEDDKFVSNAARATTPSFAQLELIRTFCESLHDPDKSESRFFSFLSSSSDVDRDGAEILKRFYNESYYYPYLILLSDTIAKACDLSSLWYREFYLEMTKQVQFPISSSLPYVLVRECMARPHATENIFYVMEIYNDAANFALHSLGQRHLFDEIESECDLALEQMVFILGDRLYNHYKSAAASRKLSPSYRSRLREFKSEAAASASSASTSSKIWPIFGASQKVNPPGGILELDHQRFSSLLSQSNVRLLGRSVDFSRALTFHVDVYLRNDLQTAVSKFESSKSLSGAMELKSILDVLRETHETFEKHLHLESFDSLMKQIDSRVSPSSFRGRIGDAVRDCLLQEVVPKYSYHTLTERFIAPASIINSEDNASSIYGSTFATTFKRAHELEREFVGVGHLQAAIECMGGIRSLPPLIRSIVNFVGDLLQEQLSPAISAQIDDALPSIQAVRNDYNFAKRHVVAGGVVQSAKSAFKHYDDAFKRFDFEFSESLLRAFHEMGNAVVLLKMIQACVDELGFRDIGDYGHLFGHDTVDRVGPGSDAREPPAAEATPLVRRAKLATNAILTTSSEFTPEQEDASRLVHLATRAASVHVQDGRKTPLFTNCLSQIQDTMKGWKFTPGKSKPWYEAWSALQFLVARVDSRAHVLAKKECSGDGFLWGGNFFAVGCFPGSKPGYEIIDACLRIARFDYLDKVAVGNNVQLGRKDSSNASNTGFPSHEDASDDLNACLATIRLVYEPTNATILSTLEISVSTEDQRRVVKGIETKSYHPMGWSDKRRAVESHGTEDSNYPSVGTAYEAAEAVRAPRPKSVVVANPSNNSPPPPPPLPRPGSGNALILESHQLPSRPSRSPQPPS